MHFNKYSSFQKGFTLIELLIVIGIIAILATVVVIIINPGQTFSDARDAKRILDINTLNDAITLYASRSLDINASLTAVYISITDSDPGCANVSSALPSLPPLWSYKCSSPSNYKNTDGTGWIPIDFDSMETGSPIGELPVDPVNLTTNGRYYAFVYNGGWEITAVMEGDRNKVLYGAVVRSGNHKNITPSSVLLRSL